MDGDRARAQSSLFQVTCAFWDQIVGTCWSLGRAVLALCCYRPHHRWGPSRKAQGLCQACQCCSDPYSLSCNSLLPLCYHQPTTWPWELPFWGIRGRGGSGRGGGGYLGPRGRDSTCCVRKAGTYPACAGNCEEASVSRAKDARVMTGRGAEEGGSHRGGKPSERLALILSGRGAFVGFGRAGRGSRCCTESSHGRG